MRGTTGTDSPAPNERLRAAPPGRSWRSRSRMAVAAVLLASVALGACGDDDGDEPAASTTSAAPSSTADPATSTTAEDTTTTTTDPNAKQAVRVYLTSGEVVGAAGRNISGTGVARAALESLLAGPNDVESGIDMGTEIPDGTEVLGLNIVGGVATVDLSGAFESGGGSLSMSLRVAQVVFTLTQFDTVETVNIRIDGEDVDGIGGEGVPAANLTRADFEEQSPAILVESPNPGAEVAPSFTVSGTSNTFEASYEWAILADDGTVLAQDFGTATSGTGTRGTFDFDVDLGDHAGPVTVKVFESSAKDGSEINVVTIPVTVG